MLALRTRSSRMMCRQGPLRFNSSKSPDGKSSNSGSYISTSEIDPVLLDKLFRNNKPQTSILPQHGSFALRQRLANIQQKDKFKVLDENLLKLQSTPINFNYYLRNLKDLKNANQLPYKFGANQLVSKDSDVNDLLRKVVWEFNAPIRYAFGYGSKVFDQGSTKSSNSQVDMIYAVSYPDHWHSLNIAQNPDHYSSLRHLGSSIVSQIGELGAGVYFNPFVKLNFKRSKVDTNFELKYGVTSMNTLINDLINWDTMYLSGRLHKPVAVVRNAPKICLLNQYNLTNAIKLSLLLTNKTEISEYGLYHQIAELSYLGDPRLKARGEDVRKVDKIVTNQFEQFREMYLPLLRNYFPKVVQQITAPESAEHRFKVNLDSQSIAEIIADLPSTFRRRLLSKYSSKYESSLASDLFAKRIIAPNQQLADLKPVKAAAELSFLDLQQLSEEASLNQIPVEDWNYLPNTYKVKNSPFIRNVANDDLLVDSLKDTVKETVLRPALIQSLKGVLTAGVLRSWKYATEKRRKFNQSINNQS
ncbi:uncharacterized protein OGAPODRAFT_15093 [Ogataea polymorpha]|uniref:uncharacterized protein n=1 Tax=Ogataea polymorpha TaxID=460523 RepID=UPI0007F54423|nr:uncharacterized protein OGAPODRAFT_15093 [Ogataea polymorpha]KAG7934801.1 hypothetical protein KL934_002727 [Ogataea polymorpha]OBA18230.1 hypothetical protein OGAPODRAFT_15093 [Ogataea polymorpha]